MIHVPVLLKEVLENLNPRPDQNFIDATVGNGGHAKEILKLTAPKGKLLAFDRDCGSIETSRKNLSEFKDRVVFFRDSFGNLADVVADNRFGLANGIIFDFGMSSEQIADFKRGFSFLGDEVLDMRFDQRIPKNAQDVVNRYGEEELTEIFEKWGEEPKARKIAKAIVESRRSKKIETTRDLVEIINKVYGKRGRLHPATLVFQALRIEEIKKAIESVPKILKKEGRGVFISFHSLEDRLIKNWSKDLEKRGIIKILNKKPITASDEEVRKNPRSRSAKMRIIEKI